MTSTLPDTLQQQINHIQNDTTSGSIELATQAAHLLVQLAKTTTQQIHIKNVAIKLAQAQPAMAAIVNLANRLLITIDQKPNQLPTIIVPTICHNFINNITISDTEITEHTQNLIHNDTTIITHSYSSTVLHTLLKAKKMGKNFSVICTESRPKNEGIILAQHLAKNHIPVTLIVDSAIFSLITTADIILLGADALTNSQLINKIGTHGIATVAHYRKTPIYSLCSTIKFLPPNYKLPLYQQKNPKEIFTKKIPYVTPINYYFEATPLRLFSGIITENNILNSHEITDHLKDLKIHSSLA